MPRDAKLHYLLVTVLLGSMISGCGGPSKSEIQQIKRARIAHDAGRYDQCTQILSPVIDANRSSRSMAEAYYLRGQCRLRLQERDTAKNDLRTALRLAKDKTLRALVDAQLGNIAFDEQAYDSACTHYGRALEGLPRRAPADRVLYQYGVALQRMGRFASARSIFGRLISDYPHSSFAGQARSKCDWSESYFAVQCGSFNNAASARNMAAALRNRGLDARSFPEVRDGAQRQVVRVGRFPTYAAAERALNGIRSANPDAFIVP